MSGCLCVGVFSGSICVCMGFLCVRERKKERENEREREREKTRESLCSFSVLTEGNGNVIADFVQRIECNEGCCLLAASLVHLGPGHSESVGVSVCVSV